MRLKTFAYDAGDYVFVIDAIDREAADRIAVTIHKSAKYVSEAKLTLLPRPVRGIKHPCASSGAPVLGRPRMDVEGRAYAMCPTCKGWHKPVLGAYKTISGTDRDLVFPHTCKHARGWHEIRLRHRHQACLSLAFQLRRRAWLPAAGRLGRGF